MGKNITRRKIKAKQHHLPFNVEAVWKNIKWGRKEGEANFGEENQDLINEGGEDYQVVGNFIQLCLEGWMLRQRSVKISLYRKTKK